MLKITQFVLLFLTLVGNARETKETVQGSLMVLESGKLRPANNRDPSYGYPQTCSFVLNKVLDWKLLTAPELRLYRFVKDGEYETIPVFRVVKLPGSDEWHVIFTETDSLFPVYSGGYPRLGKCSVKSYLVAQPDPKE